MIIRRFLFRTLARRHLRWNVASRATKAKKHTTCSKIEARIRPRPTLSSVALLSRLLTLAAPLPVRMPTTISRPTKVEITRPGWMGDRYGT